MLSVLSGIVLMLAIGTLVQRGDVVANFFSGGATEVALNQDVVTVEADTLSRIDVLSNDTGLSDRDARRLVVLTQPACGRVFVQDGALQYLGERNCSASQRIVYGLTESTDNLEGEVLVTVNGAVGPRPQPAGDVVALRDTTTPAPELAATQPAAGSQGLGRPAPGQDTEPARPGLAGADAPAANAVPSVRAPSSPTAPAGNAPSVSGGQAPVIAPSSAPVQATPSPQIALRSPDAPAAFGTPASPAATTGSPQPSIGSSQTPAPATPGAPSTLAAGAPVAPSLAGVSEPVAPSAPAGIGASMAPPSIGGSSAVAGIGGSEQAPSRAAPGGLGEGIATIALARVEVPDMVAAPAAARSQELSLSVDGGADSSAPGAGRVAPEIDGAAGQQITMLEPSAGLGEILTFGDPLTLRPIDTALPAELNAPSGTSGASEIEQAALQPSNGVVTGTGADAAAQPEVLPQPDQVAALPRVDLTCAVPPSITLDIRPAGETELVITSPCHSDSVAQLSYEGLDFGIRIDRSGQGAITVLGFQSSSDAVLAFADGETLEFGLPFTGTDRVERVALAWDAPVLLELHALEFGAGLGTEGHINPQAPGNFRDVRRRGGGYLTTFAPVEGVGQSVQIYSHWLRRGGNAGVVKLYIDFASRHRDRQDGTCGNGALARPSFTVVRSSRGRTESPVSRRLASVDCAVVETMQDHLIEAAVRDIIISQR